MKKGVDIDVFGGEDSWDSVEIKYQITNLLVDREKYKQNPPNCRYIKFYSVENNAELDRIGLKSIISLVAALNGSYHLNKTKYFSAICFNQKLPKDNQNIKPSNFQEAYKGDFNIKNDIYDGLSNKKLGKMRILLMEDNPMTQKTIIFT